MQFPDFENWMPVRAILKDTIVGKQWETGDAETGNLELSLYNMIVALFLNYANFAPYKIEGNRGILAVSRSHKPFDPLKTDTRVIYSVKHPEKVQELFFEK